MIAACPKCNARYRVDEAKVGPQGARLRCARCEAVFRVRAPGTAPPQPAPQTVASPSADPATTVPAAEARSAPTSTSTSAPAEYDRQRLVLVADPQVDTGKGTSAALSSWGLQTILVHDGVEAMLSIQRALPRVVILDAALPKMYGFQVCEVIKRNEALRDTKVVLVGTVHNQDRYRRPPTDLYGADVYLEQPDLPDGLRDLMVRFGLPVATAAPSPVPTRAAVQMPAATPSPSPMPEPVAAPPPVAEPPAPAPSPPVKAPVQAPAPAPTPAPAAQPPAAPAGDGLTAEREKAERLARIVVSDIVLYQGEKFDAAIRAGNLLEALDSEIEEGRNFFRQRIDEQVRNERDFLTDELMRVARERGMT